MNRRLVRGEENSITSSLDEPLAYFSFAGKLLGRCASQSTANLRMILERTRSMRLVHQRNVHPQQSVRTFDHQHLEYPCEGKQLMVA